MNIGVGNVKVVPVAKPPKIQPNTKSAPKPAPSAVDTAADVPKVNPAKPPVKPTPVKPSRPPVRQAPPAQQQGISFQDFVNQFYPQQQAPDYNQIVQQAIQPLIQQYQNAQQQLQGWNSTANTQNSDTMTALANLLSQIGGQEYTPALAAALQQQEQQIQAYNLAQAQNGLYSNFYGGNNGINSVAQQALQSAQDAYTKSQPTGSDLLSAFNAYQGVQKNQFDQNLASRKESLAEATAQQNAAYKRAALQQLGLYRQAGVSQKQASLNLQSRRLNQQQQASIRNYNLSVAKYNKSVTDTAAKQKQASASLSKANGYLTANDGSAITKNGQKQILPGFKQTKAGKVVKVAAASAAQQAKAAQPFPNLTKAQVQHLRSGIANAFYGRAAVKDPNTGKIRQAALPPIPYQQAITEMVKGGYSRAAATRMANRFYKPGQRGRPGKVQAQNASARKGKDQTGLGIQINP